MSDIWAAADGAAQIGRLQASCWRMVESQEQVATRELVDTLEEQAQLESMLETSKPAAPDLHDLHWLLATPFRYPPLPHGSRFSGRFEPSLFYAALHRSAVLAETAYYRLVFLAGVAEPFPEPLRTQHTLFSAEVDTARGVRLDAAPFQVHRAAISDPADYRASQALGSAMRAAGVEALLYQSARDPSGGLNVALFTPAAFAASAPLSREAWLCDSSTDAVVLRGEGADDLARFNREVFLVDGRLPAPAV